MILKKYITAILLICVISLSLAYINLLNDFKNKENKFSQNAIIIEDKKDKIIKNLEKKIYALEYFEYKYKEYLTETTLKDLEFKNSLTNVIFFKDEENFLDIFNVKTTSLSYFNKLQLLRGITKSFPTSAYLDIYDNKLFYLSSVGVLGYTNLDDINNKIVFNQIENNINKFLTKTILENLRQFSVKDIKVFKDIVYISYTKQVKENCWGVSVISGKINLNKIIFEELFNNDECVDSNNLDGEFAPSQSGGRIGFINNDELVLTIGEFRYRKFAQETDNPFGKIIKINLQNKNYQIISMGHRNPQGLFVDRENQFMLNTEHGPKGGDEINFIDLKEDKIQNFGWPISSYGDHYGETNRDSEKYKKYPLHESHRAHGFLEPLTYFTPSVGISEIMRIENNKYVVATMKDKHLISFILSDDKTISDIKKHFIGERIRDMAYSTLNKKLYLYLETTGSIRIINFY